MLQVNMFTFIILFRIYYIFIKHYFIVTLPNKCKLNSDKTSSKCTNPIKMIILSGRSPLFPIRSFRCSVDIWSVGCIFAEMILRKPFLPGTDTKNQIELICEYFGTPNVDDIKQIPEESKKVIKSLPKRTGKVLEKVFSNASHEAIDLLKQFLMFDPEKRITVQEALKHPYLAHLHQEQDETSRQPLNPLDFQFQQHNLTMQQLKDLLYQQILLYNNKQFCENYEKRKKAGKSLISHILKNSNSKLIDPKVDQDYE